MSGSQLTARIKPSFLTLKNLSLKGPSLLLAYVPLLCCMSSLLLSCRSPGIFKGKWLSLMQTNDFYGNVLVIHANQFPPNKSFQGLSIILNRRAKRHLLWICRVWQPWFNRRKRGAGTKKICTSESAGIRSEAPNEPFFGTDTRWEPVLN